MDSDAQHLRLLSIFHYIVGGIAAFSSCFALIYMGFGIAIVAGALDGSVPKPSEPPPAFFGWILIAVGATIVVIGWAFAICLVLVGRKLARRTNYWFCFVMACIECCYSPFGTVLGIFTILVLVRPSVKTLFGLPART